MALPTRPFQIVVLAVFGLAALGGLALFASYGGLAGGSKSVGTVIIWGTLPAASVNGALETLRTQHKEYGNVSYAARPAATFERDLADALASGTGPDLIVITQEDLLSEQNKLSVIPFSAIPQRTYLSTYVPVSELFLADKGTYGIPFAVDPLVLYYNRTIFSSAGIANPPSTWEAVTGLAPRLTVKPGGQIQQSAIALGGYGNIPDARAIVSLFLLQAGNPVTQVTVSGPHAALSSGADTLGATPAQSAVSYYAQFADAAKTVYSWNNSLPPAPQAFISGNLALYVGFASEEPYFAAANPNLDFDMAPVPQPGTASARVTYAKVYAFAVPKASKNATGAFRAAAALASPAEAVKISSSLRMAPALRDALVPSQSDRFQPVYFPEALVAKAWLSPAPEATDRIFAAMIGSINTGLAQVQDALASADQALNAAL